MAQSPAPRALAPRRVPGLVMKPAPTPRTLVFVTAVSRVEVLGQHLSRSPCIQGRRCELIASFNAPSAAHAFDLAQASRPADPGTWYVWVHQDVHLPGDWDRRFLARLGEAQRALPGLAVAGVYGVRGAGARAVRAGHVIDRGRDLREPAPLPCVVDSLDELLIAVRADAGLRFDPALGFDFYGTDVVLQAQAAGWQAAVVDACCSHASDTPARGPFPPGLMERVGASGDAFERKWRHRLPLTTPCFDIHAPGDVATAIRTLQGPSA